MQVEPLLRVKNLTIDRGHHRVVEGVSFDLHQGSHTAIIGPNGAGKSSLVQAVLGLIPFQGTIEFSAEFTVGYIPQKFPFDRGFPLSVKEMVALGAGRRASPQKVREALWEVGLADKSHRPIGVLSGGELKRMLLAHCLVLNPQLLVLDEAMAGVDRQGALCFMELLKQLRRCHGWTILEVSHDIKILEHQADWVIGLNRSVVIAGSPSQLLTPEHLAKLYGG